MIVKKYNRSAQTGKELRALVDRDEKAIVKEHGPVVRETSFLKDDPEFDVVVIWTKA